MAEVNASIPLQGRQYQIKSPVEHYTNALALQNAQQANDFNALKMSQAQWADANDRESDAAMREFYSGSRDDASLNALARRSPKAYTAEQKRRLDEEKERAEIRSKKATTEKTELERQIKVRDYGAQLIRGAVDQPTWSRVRDEYVRLAGPDAAARIPVEFDPQYRDMWLKSTLSEKEQLEATARQRAADVAEANNLVTVSATGKASPNEMVIGAKSRIAQAGAAQVPIQVVPTAGGLGAVTTRVVRGQPTVNIIPINEPGGDRAKPAPSIAGGTEDERKAAGWFKQSVFAFKNMTDALAQDPEAAQPGAVERGLQFLPGTLGDDAANARRSPQRQRYMQAASSFSEAVLRAATGAGVNKEEALQKVNEITPRYGDGPEVILQKQEALSMYLESLRTRAGKALPAGTPLPPGADAKTDGPAKVTSDAEYKALPSGAPYIAPDGTTRRKR